MEWLERGPKKTVAHLCIDVGEVMAPGELPRNEKQARKRKGRVSDGCSGEVDERLWL